jgi:hypothetical protein
MAVAAAIAVAVAVSRFQIAVRVCLCDWLCPLSTAWGDPVPVARERTRTRPDAQERLRPAAGAYGHMCVFAVSFIKVKMLRIFTQDVFVFPLKVSTQPSAASLTGTGGCREQRVGRG